MIIDYHRPKNLEQALQLLKRTDRVTIPLAGGTAINRHQIEDIEVMDLQDLGLDQIQDRGVTLELGATATLQSLLDFPGLSAGLSKAIRHEATQNLRQAATVVGTLVAASGRSPFTTALLALDATLGFISQDERMALGDFLNLKSQISPDRLITRISIPTHVVLTYEYVARTPADLPIVCVALVQWPSGRTRVALGGFGTVPTLAMDGPENQGADIAAMNAYSQAGDQWASAEYRQEIAGILTRRCLSEMSRGKNPEQ